MPHGYGHVLDADRVYEQFYGAMEKWGRYGVLTSPADAQLNFEIGLPCPPGPNLVNHGSSWAAPTDPQFRLVIRDMKSRTVLWVITEHIDDRGSQRDFDKSLGESMEALMSKLRQLAGPSARPPVSVGTPSQRK
jgi:hypothetical protein